MRLWHKDLIPALPRKQLLAQWRECCAIASNIAKKGTPNHILVNKVLASFLYIYLSSTVPAVKQRADLHRSPLVEKFRRSKFFLAFSPRDQPDGLPYAVKQKNGANRNHADQPAPLQTDKTIFHPAAEQKTKYPRKRKGKRGVNESIYQICSKRLF